MRHAFLSLVVLLMLAYPAAANQWDSVMKATKNKDGSVSVFVSVEAVRLCGEQGGA